PKWESQPIRPLLLGRHSNRSSPLNGCSDRYDSSAGFWITIQVERMPLQTVSSQPSLGIEVIF
ncbi:MAG: hypothetical protein P8O70_16470, partial [SAR324 cluster bacterium]|nr:hypothetical protein [SAR324 cluster bacterium]